MKFITNVTGIQDPKIGSVCPHIGENVFFKIINNVVFYYYHSCGI